MQRVYRGPICAHFKCIKVSCECWEEAPKPLLVSESPDDSEVRQSTPEELKKQTNFHLCFVLITVRLSIWDGHTGDMFNTCTGRVIGASVSEMGD
jgi:hypothetical protein